jgi:glycosyltransferase involved in cell wall biosynthesis
VRQTKRIRVLQVIPKLMTGGAERVALDLARHLDQESFEVAIMSLFPYTGERFEQEATELNIKVFYLSKRLGFQPKVWFEVNRLFQEFKPDVVHNHLYALYTVLPSVLWHAVPARLHTVHNIAVKDAIGKRVYLNKLAFRYLDCVPVSISRVIQNTVHEVYGNPESPVIYNGVDLAEYNQQPQQRELWRLRNGIDKDIFVFVCVARLALAKNHRLLIEAFNQVVQNTPNTILLLVGDGELRSDIADLIECFGLQEKVRMLGQRSDIKEILNASDAFVLSSNWEGLPISVLEAMSTGKPIIATNVGGISELIFQGRNGYLVEQGNCGQLSVAMEVLCHNPSHARNMGRASRQIVLKAFGVREMAHLYGLLYLDLLKRNSDSSGFREVRI